MKTKTISLFNILLIVSLPLMSCAKNDSPYFSSKNIEKYGLQDFIELKGSNFDKNTSNVASFTSTEEQFSENANNLYTYLKNKYPNTLCYISKDEMTMFGARYEIMLSESLNQHLDDQEYFKQYTFIYSLTDTISDSGTYLNERRVILFDINLYINSSSLSLSDTWCTYKYVTNET